MTALLQLICPVEVFWGVDQARSSGASQSVPFHGGAQVLRQRRLIFLDERRARRTAKMKNFARPLLCRPPPNHSMSQFPPRPETKKHKPLQTPSDPENSDLQVSTKFTTKKLQDKNMCEEWPVEHVTTGSEFLHSRSWTHKNRTSPFQIGSDFATADEVLQGVATMEINFPYYYTCRERERRERERCCSQAIFYRKEIAHLGPQENRDLRGQ